MDTGAHIVCNLIIQSRTSQRYLFFAIIAGAILPDLPMIVFYAWESLVKGTAESVIWTELYFLPAWQNFFDTFNSLPFIVLLLALAIFTKRQVLAALAISMILHVLLDLPLHHDDAHRHFFPFSDWKFASPVSYWDPRFHGDIMQMVALAVVAIGLIILWFRHPKPLERAVMIALGAGYVMFQIFVAAVWAG